MKKVLLVFAVIAILLCGCAKENPYTIIKSDTLPVDAKINGKKVTITNVGFYGKEDYVYAIIFIDTSNLKKPFSEDFVRDHFSDSSTLQIEGELGMPAHPVEWDYSGRIVFATDNGDTVCLCSCFTKVDVEAAIGYKVDPAIYSDKMIKRVNDAGQTEEVRAVTYLILGTYPIELKDYSELSYFIKKQIENPG